MQATSPRAPTYSLAKAKLDLELEKRRRQAAANAVAKPKAPTFRGANLEIQSYRGREWLLSGPAETGKTWATVWLLDSLLRATPKAQGILARKLQVSIAGTVLVTYKRIQELRELLGDKPAKAYGGQQPQWFDYDNGARLWIGGMDNPQKILSGERDFIYINQAEELELHDWETLLTRCTGRGAVTKTPMLFGDCNPGPEDHWALKRETLKIFHSKHVDNPSLYDDDGNLTEQGERSINDLKSLTGVRKSRLYLGLWVGAEGLYFEEWDEELHTCEPFEIPEDWPIWGALDYGFSHNTAIGLFTEDNDGGIYLIAEHVKNKWLAPLHCKAIRRQAQKRGIDWYRINQFVAGHDVFQERGSKDGKKIADQYLEAVDPETQEDIGIYLEKATIDRVTGAQELLARIGNAEMGIKPTLKIFNTCKRTITTLTRMVCDPRDAEDVKKVDSDLNGDGGDDPYDMLRYGVMVKYIPSQSPQAGGERTQYTSYQHR